MNAKETKNVQEDVNKAETEEKKAQDGQSGNPPEDAQGQQTQPKKDNIFKRAAKKVSSALDKEIKFTPKKVLLTTVGVAAAVVGIKLIYEKGKEQGKEDASMENALEGDEMLALPGETYEEVAQDYPEETEVVDVTEYEEADEEYVDEE